MSKTAEMRVLELEHGGRDIRDLISEAVAEAGSIDGAAVLLGVKGSTLWKWINERLEGEVERTTTAVVRFPAEVAS